MAIVKYNPLSELRSMQEKMNRLLDLAWTREVGEELKEGVWQPPADIFEDDDAVTMKLELPDLEQKDVEIRVDEKILIIRGERKHGEHIKKENFHRIERYYGPFQRSFALPAGLLSEDLTVSCEDGVLTITIPKAQQGQGVTLELG